MDDSGNLYGGHIAHLAQALVAKGAQIAVLALTAKALHRTLPVGSFSWSTEAHNQGKIGIRVTATRHAWTTEKLTGGVAAFHRSCVAPGRRSGRDKTIPG